MRPRRRVGDNGKTSGECEGEGRGDTSIDPVEVVHGGVRFPGVLAVGVWVVGVCVVGVPVGVVEVYEVE